MIDFGRYLGRPEPTGRGRSEAERVTTPVGGDAASAGLGARVADPFLRVIVLDSGVPALFAPGEGALDSVERRDEVAAKLTALERRVSLALLDALSVSLPSLFITSARALPTLANPRERRTDLVATFWLLWAASVGGIAMDDSKKGGIVVRDSGGKWQPPRC